ncbi:hypothetical protein Pvag_0450 [Pantoea vagans C9-1]|uniref:DUF481 domain-containing protein n=1 Tax=Pantoea vagans TaxID=470934 RepID=UPI0001E59360|nr:hypothetical protein Pvag_0450 [Pantoea vagans C9-1]
MRCAILLTRLLVIFCCTGWAEQAAADTVWLNNGDRLTGTIRYLSDGKLAIETHYAGTVTLAWNAVSTLASDNPVNVENKKTGEHYQVRLSSSDPGYVWVERNEQEQQVSVSRIDEFMKAKVRTDQLAWTGNIDAGVKVKKASTKTDDYSFALNTKLNQGKWRHDIGATYNREHQHQ